MPNGGSDHCGNCRHNRLVMERQTREVQRLRPAFCTVRNVEVKAWSYTYCANHYVDERTPVGPMFSTIDEHERVPYHGTSRPMPADVRACRACGAPGRARLGVHVQDPGLGLVEFCSAAHYVRWWKSVHPGEPLKWDASAES